LAETATGAEPEPLRNKPMNPSLLPPLASSNLDSLALRVDLREARDLADLLLDPDFRNAENEALAARLQRAVATVDQDELTEGLHFARKALNLSCACCGEELANAEPSRSRQYCSRSCGEEELA
jgi:hypothetical protein